jgi:tetrahedral aminopeptidase
MELSRPETVRNGSSDPSRAGITLPMNLELLRELTEAHGTSGYEDNIREIVKRELAGVGDISVDSMGSVHCVVNRGGGKKVMLAAHMDEIGFVVKYVDDKGFLRLHTVGGWDPRNMASQRVVVHTSEGPMLGLLVAQGKPKHMQTGDEASKAPTAEMFFLDLGLSGEDAKKKVQIGDMVTMNRPLQEMGNLLSCKAMDDRVAVFVMIEAVKAAKNLNVEVHAVATVQEEIGLRGAAASGSAIAPDVCIALDVTLANDFPGMPEESYVTRLGEGTAIKIMDSSLICHPKVVKHFKTLAEKHEIKHQMELLTAGGTDAGAVQRLHGGIPSFTLSIPTRYIHTVNETVHRGDVEASIAILTRFLEDAHNGDYAY